MRQRFLESRLSDRGEGQAPAPPQEDVVIRINRLGVVFGLAAVAYAAPATAQVIYRDRWADQQEAKIRADYERERSMRAQQDRMRDQQARMREQQDRMRDQMQVRMRDQGWDMQDRM